MHASLPFITHCLMHCKCWQSSNAEMQCNYKLKSAHKNAAALKAQTTYCKDSLKFHIQSLIFHFNFHTIPCCDVFLVPYVQVILHISHRIPTEDLWHVHEVTKTFGWASLQKWINIPNSYRVKQHEKSHQRKVDYLCKNVSFQFPHCKTFCGALMCTSDIFEWHFQK